ncbi:MAG: hypothetical protein AVDCRST_MAG08-1136, partial [uncultured Acetobacteraceae bacterium]
ERRAGGVAGRCRPGNAGPAGAGPKGAPWGFHGNPPPASFQDADAVPRQLV